MCNYGRRRNCSENVDHVILVLGEGGAVGECTLRVHSVAGKQVF